MACLRRVGVALLLMGFSAGAALAADGDVVLKREGDAQAGLPPAVFPHWIHRIRYTCYACHPAPFEMKAGASRMTMDEIMTGKFCGICHNGTVTWAVNFETCNRCHKAP